MASCDRGDTQFPELSGGESGSRAGSGLLAGAAAPTSRPFLAERPPQPEGAAREGRGEGAGAAFSSGASGFWTRGSI